ncbi:hypothetical protein [Streptomyces ipomoeae]|uniref:hypothetical protein n=1 Tax=Streptomyces ipomoeae TaxID=103232 RepID=UPI00131A0D67|nr:hypothetical protein [Streptomyces ipomoeae]MDX2696316.1 hypothetical protein [Streptomyces ipomoeae]MDX2843828.1 hypothetical protein [Streptomyces ipomoeae]
MTRPSPAQRGSYALTSIPRKSRRARHRRIEVPYTPLPLPCEHHEPPLSGPDSRLHRRP